MTTKYLEWVNMYQSLNSVIVLKVHSSPAGKLKFKSRKAIQKQ